MHSSVVVLLRNSSLSVTPYFVWAYGFDSPRLHHLSALSTCNFRASVVLFVYILALCL